MHNVRIFWKKKSGAAKKLRLFQNILRSLEPGLTLDFFSVMLNPFMTRTIPVVKTDQEGL